jgi:hypothetical protein
MKPSTKNIIIWSSIIGGGVLIAAILVGVQNRKDKKEQQVAMDEEVKEIIRKIDNAKK